MTAPHRGYRDGETPSYGRCEHCTSVLRVDRLDLVEEHYAHRHPQLGLPLELELLAAVRPHKPQGAR